MATSLYFNTNDQRLELFSLVWLDSNPHETRQTEQKLRSIINRLKRFRQVDQCRQYIEEMNSKERVVLIVNGRLGKELVPSVHRHRQIISIYVFCMDKESNRQWAAKFSKVKNVSTNIDQLIGEIKRNHKIEKKVEEHLEMNFFSTNTGGGGGGKSLSGINGKFLFSQVLIDCLMELPFNEEDRTELIQCCQTEYKGNVKELDKIEEFANGYSAKNVLWWYTRESFFYKILNSSLRMENLHLMFLFRSFISDICEQLKKNPVKTSIKVYRSQLIAKEEFQNLQKSTGQFISINSFFSTSLSRSTALSFLDLSDGSSDLQKILFEVSADPTTVTTKPFADISKFSDFNDEQEILFMIGSIFQIEKIENDEENEVTIVKMNLCSDEENHLRKILHQMKQQFLNEQISLRTFADVLWEMGQLKLADMYLQRFLNGLSPNDQLRPILYKDLAKLASQNGDFDQSVQWRHKLIEFEEQKSQVKYIPTTEEKTTKPMMKLNIHPKIKSTNRKWKQFGITVAGGNGDGEGLNQLHWPEGICIDDENQTIYIADTLNHRIMKWKIGQKQGEVVAGGTGQGMRIDQLHGPTNVIWDKANRALIIADLKNLRVVQWTWRNGVKQQILFSHISCYGLFLDKNGSLYVSDCVTSEIRQWKEGERNGIVVAGGNGIGNRCDQFDRPTFLSVDKDDSVYVTDKDNNRVMKWTKNAQEGIVVAGGNGKGKDLNQFQIPGGVIVDELNNVYIADGSNCRIICWPPGSREGSVIVGKDLFGSEADQLACPAGLSFDCEGNLYVVDSFNNRVQKFEVDTS
ncbi:unnamed protein product [Adineta ricciae]|uniref:ADP ribosyltransferase domain-containing protein n=1 Tax=Adineta ricciae TaxID=249248 RepID=A0A816ARA3_ADIRI|nr:unnamed protein product [Adineta ricciae]CAF1600336.1 unnamed protein product [Adineta ricciae]